MPDPITVLLTALAAGATQESIKGALLGLLEGTGKAAAITAEIFLEQLHAELIDSTLDTSSVQGLELAILRDEARKSNVKSTVGLKTFAERVKRTNWATADGVRILSLAAAKTAPAILLVFPVATVIGVVQGVWKGLEKFSSRFQ